MKKLLLALLLCPLFSAAQNNIPRFENDTLTTSGGYKIYKGQVLQFANGTSAAGYFRFVKFHQNMAKNNTYILQNGTMVVKNLKGYKYSGPENNNIRLTGTATYKDGKQEEVDILMNFERVISGSDGLPGELTVDEAFKTRQVETVIKDTKKQTVPDETKKQTGNDDIKRLLVADEIKKLFDLYKAGALTKEEYEAQKKKLLDRQ
ncbi:MAG: SHOCT domain-containing protein [Ferruginibacter sp.]